MARTHLASLVQDLLQHPAEIAVVSHRGNRRYATTSAELAVWAGCFAAELERREIAPGERVVIWGQNSAQWIAAFFGCLLRGVLAVPLDAAGTAEFAARVIQDVSPRLLVGDAALLTRLPAGVPRICLAELNAQLPADPRFEVSGTVGPDTPFQIIFTSGTTSEPRGIVHTHRNVLASLQPIEGEIGKYRKYERWVHPLRFLHTIPLSHVFGQFMGLWIPPILSAEVHFVDQLAPGRMLELIPRERISVLVAVPRIVQMLRAQLQAQSPSLAEHLQQAQHLSMLKRWWRFRRVHQALGWKFWAIISGGAALPADLEAFWNGLGFPLIQGYGMTETAALITLNHPFRIGKGSIGRALPGREVRLSDEGEILVRGDMLAGATWQQGKMRAREGEWLATGDLAAQSESGDLRFLGRKGDVIVTSAGMNVHPADLEKALAAQPGVRACVVVPCQTALGTEPVAVALTEAGDPDLQAAVRQANRSLADFQQIRQVLRWPNLEFPYTSTGKLLRRTVALWACAQLAATQQGGAAAPAGQDELRAMIAEVTGERISSDAGDGEPGQGDPLGPEVQSHQGDGLRLLEDLHLDSLGRVQLLSMLEQRLGVELHDDAIAAAETLGDLRRLVQGASAAMPGRGVSRNGEIPVPIASDRRPSAVPPGDQLHPAISAGPSGPGSAAPIEVDRRAESEDVYPTWPWTWPVRLLRIGFLELAMRPLVWLLAAPRVERESDVPPSGPVLVVANHVTAYDAALILYALPPALRRHMAIAMSGEMLRDFRRGQNQGNGLLNLLAPLAYGLITALFNVFPLPRLRGFRRSFAHAGQALDRGDSVMIFPEGRRSRSGSLQPFRPGIGLLVQESQVPVLTVALQGLGARQEGWFHAGRVKVAVGRAVVLDPGADPAQITAMLEATLRRLAGLEN